ncbi:MAG: glycosyltransferase [Candidatus Krumholzibacteriia bacterium]
MPQLSLCLIVRDEAAMLPDFLAATRDLRDEFIAVDTGSRDRTAALLTEAGATVIRFPWQDDFAAARNRALQAATGQWVLILDADERPRPELVAEIRTVTQDPTIGAATLRMRNQLPHGHIRESDLLRLWRHDAAIAFEHAIHEDASRSVLLTLQRDGRRLVNLAGLCDHLGYVREVAAGRDKKDRDLALLRRCLERDPDDWYSWLKLMEQARFWRDQALWRDTARQVVQRLDGPPPAVLPAAPWTGELLALAARGLFPDPADQVDWLDRWADRVPPSPAFFVQRGLSLERAGKLDRAHADFQRCRDLPAGTLPMHTTVRPLLGLCRVAAQRGDLLTAGDCVHQALTFAPRDPEALLAAVSFAWLNGGLEARDGFVREHRLAYGDSRELTLALGDHALQVGLWDEAAAVLAPAAEGEPHGRAHLMLAQCRLAQGQCRLARDLCRELMASLPEAGMGYLTCSLALGEPVEFSVDLDEGKANAAFKTWIRILWRSRQAQLMTTFVDHHGLVLGIFPWLSEFLTAETQKLAARTR